MKKLFLIPLAIIGCQFAVAHNIVPQNQGTIWVKTIDTSIAKPSDSITSKISHDSWVDNQEGGFNVTYLGSKSFRVTNVCYGGCIPKEKVILEAVKQGEKYNVGASINFDEKSFDLSKLNRFYTDTFFTLIESDSGQPLDSSENGILTADLPEVPAIMGEGQSSGIQAEFGFKDARKTAWGVTFHSVSPVPPFNG